MAVGIALALLGALLIPTARCQGHPSLKEVLVSTYQEQ